MFKKINIAAVGCMLMAVLFISFLLLQGDVFPFSLDFMMDHSGRWVRHWHVVTVGLLPVYVGLMIFGTALLGIMLGAALHYGVKFVVLKCKCS